MVPLEKIANKRMSEMIKNLMCLVMVGRGRNTPTINPME
jgi:hypothetical protein